MLLYQVKYILASVMKAVFILSSLLCLEHDDGRASNAIGLIKVPNKIIVKLGHIQLNTHSNPLINIMNSSNRLSGPRIPSINILRQFQNPLLAQTLILPCRLKLKLTLIMPRIRIPSHSSRSRNNIRTLPSPRMSDRSSECPRHGRQSVMIPRENISSWLASLMYRRWILICAVFELGLVI